MHVCCWGTTSGAFILVSLRFWTEVLGFALRFGLFYLEMLEMGQLGIIYNCDQQDTNILTQVLHKNVERGIMSLFQALHGWPCWTLLHLYSGLFRRHALVERARALVAEFQTNSETSVSLSSELR